MEIKNTDSNYEHNPTKKYPTGPLLPHAIFNCEQINIAADWKVYILIVFII